MKKATNETWEIPEEHKALVLRTADVNGGSSNGFVWPESGYVACDDWNPKPVCGGGLHGLMDGIGAYQLLNGEPDACWLLVEVDRRECVDIDGDKVKFPRGRVVYCGGMGEALGRISKRWIEIALEAAKGNTATGDEGHAAATGDEGHAAATGDEGHAAATGKKAIAAQIGINGRAKAGPDGAVVVGWWDAESERPRVTVGYVGEDGIQADTWYRANNHGKLEKTND